MSQRFHSIPRGAIRIPLPDATQQKDYSCGAASLQSICKYYGVGPNEEWEFVDALGMDRRVGSHPHQITRLARRLGLSYREYCPMTLDQLRRELSKCRPVMLMIQAWGQVKVGSVWRRRTDYRAQWGDGHWAVAIGYDKRGIFFEDPSLEQIRGYLADQELISRWRDTGPRGRRMHQYGVSIWRSLRRPSAYERRAVTIE